MTLSKKKMLILSTVCTLMVLTVFVLCSFSPPSFSSTVDSFPNLNQSEVDLVLSVLGHMDDLGYFTGSIPVLAYYSTNLSTVRLVCVKPGDTYQLSSTGITTSTGSTFRYELTVDGFGLKTLVSDSSLTFTSSRVLFSRSTVNDPFVINSSFAFASGSNARDSLVDMASYWYDLYNVVVNYEDDLSSSYDNGLTNGYDSGFESGHVEGYLDGFDTGYDYGYQFGYEDGYSSGVIDGYDTGYDIGYNQGDADGYESGFADGYESGFADADGEAVTEIVYLEPVEISIGSIISGVSSVPENILNGTFDFELFGINVYGLLKVIIILFVISAVVIFVVKRSA